MYTTHQMYFNIVATCLKQVDSIVLSVTSINNDVIVVTDIHGLQLPDRRG